MNIDYSNKGLDSNTSLSLLGSTTRVEIPFVKVTIGQYTLGVYDTTTGTLNDGSTWYKAQSIKYPNYIKSLEITKINGEVNTYVLNMFYQITPVSDPNFFEKIFSSVSDSRKIVFSYGDISMPTYVYRDEEAIITNVTSSFDCKNACITYTVNAVSSATLLNATTISYMPARTAKPSTVIMELLKNKKYNLQEIFYGMRNIGLVEQNGLIAKDDKIVKIEAKTNISILDYLTYLVSCMTPVSDTKSSTSKTGLYVINVVDDTSGIYHGPYFTIKKAVANSRDSNKLDTYTIDIGYPSQNIVLDFTVENNETYSIYYNYAQKITQEQYTYRINNDGNLEPVYAPLLSSGNSNYQTTESDRSWWTSVTEYPIKATITLKGLLRPAILMSYVKLNMWYFGKKHISSGTYVITKQVDTVDSSGFKTQLSLLRVAGDDSYYATNTGDYYDLSNGSKSSNNKSIYKVVNTSTK